LESKQKKKIQEKMSDTCGDNMEDGSKKKKMKKTTKTECRKRPNILITGTPGTGKSTLCEKVKLAVAALNWINVGDFAKANDCLGDWDNKYESHELDEDKLIDELEDVMADGNVLVEHHVTDIFPERWFDAIFVLRTDSTKLYDRLATRKYNEKKLQDNVQCEIFQTILEEANESYKPEIVHEIRSDDSDDIDTNAKNIIQWISQWTSDNQEKS
jgi:adenylate kinase